MQGEIRLVTETRWLSAEEQQTWRSFLLAIRLLFAEFERDVQRGAGMPLTYYEVLSVLSDAEGRTMRMSDLAVALQVSPSRISHAVSRLEGAGWIRRELCPSDRRSWFSILTDEGFAALEAAASWHVESVREHLFDQLTPAQQDHLQDISRSLLRHLSSADGTPRDDSAIASRIHGLLSASGTESDLDTDAPVSVA